MMIVCFSRHVFKDCTVLNTDRERRDTGNCDTGHSTHTHYSLLVYRKNRGVLIRSTTCANEVELGR